LRHGIGKDAEFRSLLTNASSASSWGEISVLTPNQLVSAPVSSKAGLIRVRNGRETPSAPRIGKTISNGWAEEIADAQRSRTSARFFGS
jgi:hypothetical protein